LLSINGWTSLHGGIININNKIQIQTKKLKIGDTILGINNNKL